MSILSRVVKNSGYLYMKMGISMFISLFTTRLILQSLGKNDYGIFIAVGGAIAMLGFLNSTMANATQRFMSYAEGEENRIKQHQIFNISLLFQVLVAILTVLLLSIAVMPLFGGTFNFSPDRIPAARIVYWCMVASTAFTIMSVPYESVINAHENMLYFSLVGILESLLKLVVAIICTKTIKDRLVVYGFLMALIPLVSLLIMAIYCHNKYDECEIAPMRYWDRSLAKEIISFSGWNFLTAVSSLVTAQGLGLVLNHFWGEVLNAAQGVANQLNGYLSAFSVNMMKALNPVIVKNASSGDKETMNNATIMGCKYSTILIMVFAIPCIIEMPYIVELWLDEVPLWTSSFCIMQLIVTLLCQTTSSASTAIYAYGNIKWYAIHKSIMNILPLLFTLMSFKLGAGPIWLYIPMLVIWAIGGNVVIIHYTKKYCGISVKSYLLHVALPILVISISMLIPGFLLTELMESCFLRLVICCIVTTVFMLVSLWFLCLGNEEKIQIKRLFKL